MKIITKEEGLARLEALAQEDPEITKRRIEARRNVTDAERATMVAGDSGQMTIITREEGLARLEALAQEDPEITKRRIETRRKIQAEQKEAWKALRARTADRIVREDKSEPRS